MKTSARVKSAGAFLAAIILLAGCSRDDEKFSGAMDMANYLRVWKDGCFQVEAALLKPGNNRRGIGSSGKVEAQELQFELRLSPTKTCDDLKAGSSDLVTGFGATPAEFDQRIGAFDYGLKKNFWLVGLRERIHPSMYMTERTYGMDNARMFLLQFSLSDELKSQLEINSKLELAFEIPVKGAGIAVMKWPSSAVREMF